MGLTELRRFVGVAWLLVGCAGGDGAGPGPRAPVITVTGVEDGAVVTGSVTISIAVDVGTYAATLDGVDFFSGSTVEEAGPHLLEVFARNGEATSSLTVGFELRVAFSGGLVVRVFDLGANDAGGGGDAILLTDSTAAGQQHVLVDAGPAGRDGSDPGLVLRRLEELGVDTLEALVLSHAHTDHFLGMPAVLDVLFVRRFVHNGQARTLGSYRDLLDRAEARAAETLVPSTPLVLPFGRDAARSELRVLPPLPDFLADAGVGSSEINEGSLGAALTRGSFRMFLTGDGEVEANRRWRTRFAEESGDVDVLKVGHHGANDAVFDDGGSGTSTWLEHTGAEIQLVSANGTSHPRIRALSSLLGRGGARTYCTNVHGDMELRVDASGALSVSVERNRGMDCVPGSDATT